MFPVDSVSATYMEARLQDQRQRQQEQEAAAQKAAAQKPAAPSQGIATQSLQQPRPTFLSGMFAGFVRGGTSTFNTPITSRCATPVATPLPSPSKVPTQAEIEAALLAERKRDVDICAMPAWYH